ncbi:MAG: transglycosylase domain-containing protein [Flavobacteriales bacterium]|nr:transglycosylase domain-containing protein [Flavobacteriales bacterium]
MEEKKEIKTSLFKKLLKLLIIWFFVFTPAIGLWGLINLADDETLPEITELENPKTDLASVVLSSDYVQLGKYYHENRTNTHYNNLPKSLVDALVATEDERFFEHSGIDVRALLRVFKGLVSGDLKGGGSTITQQLAKLLFPRKRLNKFEFALRKFKEWIIASKLEKNYTKEEILSMYLNKFDFLNNAVGINSAAQVYFNKIPKELELHESAMLIGMAKNPSLFNPIRRPDTVLKRRTVVLYQMYKNKYISKEVFDSTKKLELDLDYNKVDHQTGLAPYFREILRLELGEIFSEKDENDEYIIKKSNGEKFDLYSDGLKIYTSIDSRMQKHAEKAVESHFKNYLQTAFDRNNEKNKNNPFSNDITKSQADTILARALKQSMLYKKLVGKACSYCERPKKYIVKKTEGFECSYCGTVSPFHTKDEIAKKLNEKRTIKVFDWNSENFEKDTLFSTKDSVKYYKGLLRAGLMSMNPHNGEIKAWVGGPNFKHFKYDMVKKGRRQVGSTFKPFVYATALESGVVDPCYQVPDIEYCIEVPFNEFRKKLWCPTNSGDNFTGALTSISFALANSMNNITASIIKKGSMINDVFNRVAQLGIDTSKFDQVPAMALGVFDISVHDIVGAIAPFANQGVYMKPVYLLRIEDKFGNLIFEPKIESKQVWNRETAYSILEMMKLVTNGVSHPTLKNAYGNPLRGGTAIRIRSKVTKERPYTGITQPIAGKTGTTQNQSDGWFMGLTPDLVTGVWVGAEDRSVRFNTLNMGMGTNTALPVFAYYTKYINADDSLNISQKDFEMPETMLKSPIDCNEAVNNTKVKGEREDEWSNDDNW